MEEGASECSYEELFDSIHSSLSSNSKDRQKRRLSLNQLMIIIFLITCGGPFGIEQAIQSGGALYTLIGLIIIPIIYSIPHSLICCELASMMPSYHGYIVWVYRGFKDIPYIGTFIGFYNSISKLISMSIDIPIHIILMSFYLEEIITTSFTNYQITFWRSYLFKLFIIIIAAIFNTLNIRKLSNVTIIFSFVILLPFIIGFSYSLSDISNWSNSNNNKPYNTDNEYQWILFLSILLWLHTGYDSIGSLTTELRFSNTKLFYPFIGGIILNYLSYTIPILGAITLQCHDGDIIKTDDGHNGCWDNTYFYLSYNEIVPYLGVFILISGFISNVGIYIIKLSIQSRICWSLSQPQIMLITNGEIYGEMFVKGHDNIYDDYMNIIIDFDVKKQEIMEEKEQIKYIQIGILPQWLCGTIWNKTGSPIRGVLVQSVINAFLILFDVKWLLKGAILINCTSLILQFISFIILRYKESKTYRPYKIFGGILTAWFITICSIVSISIFMASIIYENILYLYMLCGNIIFVMMWYFIYYYYMKYYNKNNINNNDNNGNNNNNNNNNDNNDIPSRPSA